jgi:hypothetical protein
MLQRSCDWCGRPYLTRRPDVSRFCHTNCRKRSHRAGPRSRPGTGGPTVGVPDLAEAVRAELRKILVSALGES